MKIVLTLFISLSLLSCGKQTPKNSAETKAQEALGEAYLDMVNQHRKALGLRSLVYSFIIEEVAQGHSDYMSQGFGRFGHNGWKKRCQKIRDQLQGNACSEIVAMGQKDTKEVFKAWLNSPSHRASLEDSRYTHTALAFSQNAKGVIYWTQLFLDVQ